MKVLVLTHRLPFAPNRGDRVRAYHLVRQLARRASVHVVSLVHDDREEAEAEGMRRSGIAVTTARVPRLRNYVRGAAGLLSSTPLTHMLLDSPAMRDAIAGSVRESEPDVVLAYCSGMARFALEAPLDRYPFVLDVVDVDSGKWADFARAARGPRRWLYRREARCLAAFETMAARRAQAATVVTAREAEALRALSPEARTVVISNGVDMQYLAPPGPPAADPSVVFTGVFSYAPNADGAVWFAERVWPRVRERFAGARLTLAGASPLARVRRLAGDSSIVVTGQVPDIRPYLWQSAVAVAPLFEARGVQNKVLEAAAAGLPSVVTSAVWGGLPQQGLAACRLANDPADFAAAIIDLLSLTPPERRAIAGDADLGALTWSGCLAPLCDLIEAVPGDLLARQRAGGPAHTADCRSAEESLPPRIRRGA
jgi:sugar transferase (PEP-CTERM/EpsH1 system associated)